MNPTAKPIPRTNPDTPRARVVEIGEAMPTSEDERTAEALRILCALSDVDTGQLTSWEMNTVNEIKEGKAATKVRLKELREIYKRLRK